MGKNGRTIANPNPNKRNVQTRDYNLDNTKDMLWVKFGALGGMLGGLYQG